MYSAENYLWGWIAYSAGALCLLLCLWLLVRKISVAAIRHIILMFALVAFFTPVTAYRDDPHLAPAFFVSLYEGLLASGRYGLSTRSCTHLGCSGDWITVLLYCAPVDSTI